MNRVVCALTVAILSVGPVFADPVRITSGRVTGSTSSITDYAISGADFQIGGTLGAYPVGEPHYRCGAGQCPPGSPVDLSTRYMWIQEVEVNGVWYRGVSGYFDFTSETVIMPDVAADETVQIVRPFSFRAHLEGVGSYGTLDLFGSGSVIAFLYRAEEGPSIDRTDYVFADPVPEPASMLLLGSGLAGLAAARRRRRTSSDQRLTTSD